MAYTKKIDYLLVIIGCIVAIYAQAGVKQNVYLLVFGVVLLMYGLFKISVTIPNKKSNDEDSNF